LSFSSFSESDCSGQVYLLTLLPRRFEALDGRPFLMQGAATALNSANTLLPYAVGCFGQEIQLL